MEDEADFVAMIDVQAATQLQKSLEANRIVAVKMDFEERRVFDDYLLMRKFYVLKLTQYDKVLLLDSDSIVVGSLRHVFVNDAKCGETLSATGDDACWPETDRDVVCAPRGKPALVMAQQTAGTPILTAFFLVRPDRAAWLALTDALEQFCGGTTVCNRRHIYARGWNATQEPHDWALRRGRSSVSLRYKDSSWRAMGAGFTDQGFAEYYFALHLKSLYSISHRTCKLHYVHFNMPPKPWFCPSSHCVRSDTRHVEGDLRWGGHKCAADWYVPL